MNRIQQAKPRGLVVLTWACGALAVAFLVRLVVVGAFMAFLLMGEIIAHGNDEFIARSGLLATGLGYVVWLLLVICIVQMNRTWKAHPESRRWQSFALFGLLCVLFRILIAYIPVTAPL